MSYRWRAPVDRLFVDSDGRGYSQYIQAQARPVILLEGAIV